MEGVRFFIAILHFFRSSVSLTNRAVSVYVTKYIISKAIGEYLIHMSL